MTNSRRLSPMILARLSLGGGLLAVCSYTVVIVYMFHNPSSMRDKSEKLSMFPWVMFAVMMSSILMRIISGTLLTSGVRRELWSMPELEPVRTFAGWRLWGWFFPVVLVGFLSMILLLAKEPSAAPLWAWLQAVLVILFLHKPKEDADQLKTMVTPPRMPFDSSEFPSHVKPLQSEHWGPGG